MRPRTPVTIILLATFATAVGSAEADAATITVAYEAGYHGVIINGYGAAGMGTFRLRDGDTTTVALCLEADVSHTKASEAYGSVPNQVHSTELDTLLWWLSEQPVVDADTGVAAAALAWYYAAVRRTIGVPVWADGHRNFAPIGPLDPESWEALPPFSMNHMIGLVSGATHLDAAERRVAALHRLVTDLAGPWRLDADPTTRSFRLSTTSGPIPGRPMRIVIAPTVGPATTLEVVTDGEGKFMPDLGTLPDGALVTAVTEAPGIHREWDGPGSVQRMATPTSADLTAAFEVPPLPRYVEVRKSSSDPTIGVAGAQFEIRDTNGVVAATSTSDPRGVAPFGPIDPVAHPAPYTVHEITSPIGLVASAQPVPLDVASTDPSHPTAVEIVNEPDRVALRVRKTLSMPSVGPPDRSGFRFLAVRREDGESHQLTTEADGVTSPVDLAIGTYDVCESAVPAWATSTSDGGCRRVEVTPETLTSTDIVVEYLNVVAPPSIDTFARDAVDGDAELVIGGGTVIDRVTLERLVPGTTYEVQGEVIALASDTIATPTGITAHAAVLADNSTTELEIAFQLPPLAPGRYVIVERVEVDGRVVAVHDDLGDVDQTVEVVAPLIPTTTSPPTSTTPTSTTIPIGPVPPTLPPTGSGAAALMRLGDIGFLVGVGLVVVAGVTPRRRRRHDDLP